MKKFFAHRPTASACHIIQALKKGEKLDKISFHTPGHKCTKWDVTELSYSDCLASPEGCLLRAQKDVEGIVRSQASEFLTDGSTSGVYALLYLLKEKGVKKLALSPFSHISAFRACEAFGLEPIAIEGQTPLSQPTKAQMEEALSKADALFLTSPNYYGKVADLPTARRVCDGQEKPFVVDGAHGGHLHYKPWQYAGSYADAWVDGVHKSMPAMTQAALVSVAKAEWVDAFRKVVPIFRTTSPSYPVMASIEYAYKYPRNPALELQAYTLMRENPTRILLSDDWTKVCCVFGKKANAAAEWFEKQGVYPEFCDGKYLLFYLSPATKFGAFKVLKRKLKKAFLLFPFEGVETENARTVYEKSDKTEWVEIEKAAGRVAASSFGLFPPCLPLATDGQRIDEEILRRLEAGKNRFGVKNGKIEVYQKGEERCEEN